MLRKFLFVVTAVVLVLGLAIPVTVLAAPAPASNLTARAFSATRVDLFWADNSLDEDGFRIERSTGTPQAFAPVGSVGPGATTFTDVTVTGSVTYDYRVIAFNSLGDSAPAGPVSVATPAVPPAPPGGGGGGVPAAPPPPPTTQVAVQGLSGAAALKVTDAGIVSDNVRLSNTDGNVNLAIDKGTKMLDKDGKAWQELESTVDAGGGTVTARVAHFTIFGLMAKLPPPPPPAPAQFSITQLSISPETVKAGEMVTISATVANTGGSPGKTQVELMIEGVQEGIKEVSLDAGANQKVSFTIKKTEAGTYNVGLGGIGAQFNVTAAPPAPPAPVPPVTAPAPPNYAPLIGMIVAAVVVAGILAYLFILRKRKA